MPKKSKNNKLKPYETKSITWNKGKQGKYKILSKINREAFEKAQTEKFAVNKEDGTAFLAKNAESPSFASLVLNNCENSVCSFSKH